MEFHRYTERKKKKRGAIVSCCSISVLYGNTSHSSNRITYRVTDQMRNCVYMLWSVITMMVSCCSVNQQIEHPCIVYIYRNCERNARIPGHQSAVHWMQVHVFLYHASHVQPDNYCVFIINRIISGKLKDIREICFKAIYTVYNTCV
jgi:hypothetical protein